MKSNRTYTKTFLVGMVAGLLIMPVFSAPAYADTGDNTTPPSQSSGGKAKGYNGFISLLLTANNGNNGLDSHTPVSIPPPKIPEPTKIEKCTPSLVDVIDPVTKKPVIDPVTKKTKQETKNDCKMVNDPAWTTITHFDGYAYWDESTVLLESFPGGFQTRSENPANLPPGGEKFYVTECKSDYREIKFEGFSGFYSPIAVKWTDSQVWWVDSNNELQKGTYSVEYYGEAEGGCLWPNVGSNTNTCPLWLGNVYAYGPTGDGLPVEIGPNVKDPASVAQTVGRLKADGKEVNFSKMGTAFNDGTFDSMNSQGKASLTADCNTDLAQDFDFWPAHTGNYEMWGKQTTVKCNYISFMTVKKLTGCDQPYNITMSQVGWKDCDYNVWEGALGPDDYDFSCTVPVVNIVCTGETCTNVVKVPEPMEDPTKPPTLIPVPIPNDNKTLVCLHDTPMVETPQGKTYGFLNKTLTVGSDGSLWALNWGDMQVFNVSTTGTTWTNNYVESGSTPGKEDLKASDPLQPFNGEYNNKRVLMWDGDLTDNTKGVDGPPWAKTLNMHWYTAGMKGVSDSSLFTVYQNRNFTWEKNGKFPNWNGSIGKPQGQLIPQTCTTTPASFIVVQGRSAGG